MRSPKSRTYRMIRRAERVDETRRRITDAAIRLHTSVGPSETSIARVAEEAGVTRLTVYRHFPDMAALFAACSAHWFDLHPSPDPARWVGIEDDEARIRAGIAALYAWYEEAGEELYPIHRDLADVPEPARTGIVERRHDIADSLLAPAEAEDPDAHRRRRAVARHVADVRTWHALRAEGLSAREAVDLTVRFVLDAGSALDRQ